MTRKLSVMQLEVLEEQFKKCEYVDRELCLKLEDKLCLSAKQVRTWFSTRRAKARKNLLRARVNGLRAQSLDSVSSIQSLSSSKSSRSSRGSTSSRLVPNLDLSACKNVSASDVDFSPFPDTQFALEFNDIPQPSLNKFTFEDDSHSKLLNAFLDENAMDYSCNFRSNEISNISSTLQTVPTSFAGLISK